MKYSLGLGLSAVRKIGSGTFIASDVVSNVDAYYAEQFVTSGADITQWTDLSGNGNHATPITANIAQHLPSDLGGFPAADIIGKDYGLQTGVSYGNLEPFSIGLVATVERTTTNDDFIIGASNSDNRFVRAGNTNNTHIRRGGSGTQGTPLPANNAAYIFIIVFGTTTGSEILRANGVEYVNVVGTISVYTNIYLGDRLNAAGFTGKLHEAIIKDGSFTAQEISDLESGWSGKFGISI